MRRAAALLLTLLLAGPARAEPPAYAAQPGLAGRALCAGGETMRPLLTRWAALFAARQPGAEVAVDPKATLSAQGVASLLAGTADCVAFVREPFPAELAALTGRFGRPPRLVPVAGGSYDTKGGTHAIAIYVNAANKLDRLTMPQLASILRADDPVRRWGELGLGGKRALHPIHVYGMLHVRESGNPPGVVNFVQQRVLGGGALRPDIAEQSQGDVLAAIVAKIAADPDGIGYSGFAFAQPGTKTLALAETEAGPYLVGTRAEVASRAYPLSRRIYLMLAPDRDRSAGLVEAFARLAVSAEGQALLADDPSGFLPLTAAEAAASAALLR